jgi:sec-independent protein translocase protein TatA
MKTMLALMANFSIFADILGGWEVVFILGVVLIIFGVKRLPELGRGLGQGFSRFGKEIDQAAHDAGESLGGIYGKPAAEALTPDNHTAELYDPAALENEERTGRATKRVRFRGWRRLWRLIWHSILKRLKTNI